jgi:Tol biopolymer transport system component
VIYSVDTTGGAPTALTRVLEGGVSSVVVLPGDRLLYASTLRPTESAIFEWRPGEAQEPRLLVTLPETDGVQSLAATADGTRISYVRAAGQLDVFVADVKEGNRAIGPARRVTLDDRADVPTDWSLDGRLLFYSLRRGTFDVFAQALDDDEATLLAGTPGWDAAPRATPDGRWILYFASDPQGQRLMRIPVEGGPSAEVVESPQYVHHRCGQRARCILVETHDEAKVVYELDPLQGRGRELFRMPERTGDPAVSPDGERMAYLAFPRQGAGQEARSAATPVIVVVDLAGRPRLTLPVPGFHDVQSLDWAADGRGFYTTGFTSFNETTLLYVDLKGEVVPLHRQPGTTPRWAIPSRQGSYLAIAGTTWDMNAWMVDGL